MNEQITKAIRTDTKIAWGITEENGFSYDPEGFWLSLQKRMNAQPLSDSELSNYMRAYIICTILEINRRWPARGNEGKNDFQASILSIVVADLMEFYEKDPQRFLFNYIPKLPTTDAEKRHLHCHIKGKARLQIKTALDIVKDEERDPSLKPRKVKKQKRDGLWMDITDDEYTAPASFSADSTIQDEDGESTFEIPDERYIAEIEISETDEVVLANQGNLNFSKGMIANEVKEFFNEFYLDNRTQLNNISPYFTNISFYNIRTKDIWTTNKLVWKAIDVWDRLVKIDQRLELTNTDKELLYHFYLVICVLAMKQKEEGAIVSPSTVASKRIVISKPIADVLYSLIVKTFLYFTYDLNVKVFSRVDNPPPVSESDISKFSNAIKDKPREVLKKKNLPKNLFLTPEEAEEAKEEARKKREEALATTNLSATSSEIVNENIFSSDFNLHDLFESYEVFEYLTEKVKKAFKTGKLEEDDSVNVSDLKAFLSENRVEMETIFNFLNPMSQKDKEDKDYNYITQGAISAITTAIMSSFKKEEGKLQIVLTKDENSLDTEMLAEMTSDFLKSIIEKDFDIKRGDVSSEAASIVKAYLSDCDEPFKVSIPEGTEYDSFRTMVEMNGPIKVSVPFTTQDEAPIWSDEKVLDDKMVHIVDKSITDAMNQINIGKEILKHL